MMHGYLQRIRQVPAWLTFHLSGRSPVCNIIPLPSADRMWLMMAF